MRSPLCQTRGRWCRCRRGDVRGLWVVLPGHGLGAGVLIFDAIDWDCDAKGAADGTCEIARGEEMGCGVTASERQSGDGVGSSCGGGEDGFCRREERGREGARWLRDPCYGKVASMVTGSLISSGDLVAWATRRNVPWTESHGIF